MDRYCGVVAGLVLDIGWGEGQINGLLIYKLLDQGRSVPPWWRRLCISQRFRNLSLMGLDGTLGWGRKQVDSMGRKKHTFMSLVARGRNVDCRLSTKIYPLLCVTESQPINVADHYHISLPLLQLHVTKCVMWKPHGTLRFWACFPCVLWLFICNLEFTASLL